MSIRKGGSVASAGSEGSLCQIDSLDKLLAFLDKRMDQKAKGSES